MLVKARLGVISERLKVIDLASFINIANTGNCAGTADLNTQACK